MIHKVETIIIKYNCSNEITMLIEKHYDFVYN